MKVRDLVQHLNQNGANWVRQKGSHGIWKLPNGMTFSMVVNHMNDDVSGVILKKARREFKLAGMKDIP